MPKPSNLYGFNGPPSRPTVAIVLPRLAATLALGAGTAIAATAVSMGIARAQVIDSVPDHDHTVFGLAILLGVLFAAACLSAVLASRRNARRPAPSDHVARHPPLF
jgi:hypothetical protein